MRVGIQLPEVEREVRWPEYVAMARAAEAAGFDSIWVGDHLLSAATANPSAGLGEVAHGALGDRIDDQDDLDYAGRRGALGAAARRAPAGGVRSGP